MKLINSCVMINNKLEDKCFLYDRRGHRRFDINVEMFDLIKSIHLNNMSYDDAVSDCDKETIDFLIENVLLTSESESYISNIKEIDSVNNARVFMEVTDKCNLNCKHCYGGFAIENKNFVKIDKVFRIIDQAEKLGVYEFDLTGGEPLMYPQLEQLLEKLYNAGMLVSIFTNLVLLSEKKITLLQKYGVKKIITSLDSCKEEIHEEFRGMPGCFKKTIESINKLKSLKFEVAINTMIGNHNIDYIDEQIEFLKSFELLFVLDVIVSEGRAMNLNENTLEASLVIKSITEKYKENLNEEVNYKYCGIADRFIYIKSDGNIYICPSLVDDQFCLGNINNDINLKDIWQLMISKFSYIKCNDKDDKCKKCKGGCRARAFKLRGEICAIDEVYCNIIKGNCDV